MTIKKLTPEESEALDEFNVDEGNSHIVIDKTICATCDEKPCTVGLPGGALPGEGPRDDLRVRRLPGMRHMPGRLREEGHRLLELPAGIVRRDLPLRVSSGRQGNAARPAAACLRPGASRACGAGRSGDGR